MSLTVAELNAVYSVDEGPLNKSLGGLGSKVGGAVKGAAVAAAGLFAFGGIASGFMDLTGAASDLNETINKSSVIFGANAGRIDEWAKGAATNLGLSRQQALAAAAGFGDMFGQIGFAGDEAADMSQQVVQMSADLGSFNNLDTADVADRMSAAFRGEYDSLQALIPNINAARVEQEALAMTGKSAAKELTAQEKAAAVLAIVSADGARAMGDFAATSDGAANAAKIASAEWQNQKAVIGETLLPVLNALLSFVSGSLIPGIASGFETARGAVTAFVNAWKYNDGEVTSSGIAGYMEQFGYIARQTADTLRDMGEFLYRNREPILLIAGLIAAVFIPHLIALGVTSMATALRTAAAWVVTQAGAIGAAAVHSASIVAMIAGWVLMGAQAMIQAARMAAAWFIAMGPIGWVVGAVIGLGLLIWANWDKIKRWTGEAWDWVTGKVTGAVRGTRDAAINGFGALVAWVSGLPGRILTALGGMSLLLYSAGADLLRGMLNGITSMAGRVADAAKNAARSAVNGVKSFLGIASPSKVFTGIGINVGQGLVNGIAGMAPAVAAEAAALSALATAQSMQALVPAGTSMVRLGEVPDSTWKQLRATGWKGRAGDQQEALYRPEGQSGPLINIERYEERGASPAAVANELSILARTGRMT